MAKQKPLASKEPSSYDLLGMRIQRAINTPKAQLSKSVLLERSANDDPADWERILNEIAENDNVTIAHRDDAIIQLLWTVQKED
ncbi:DUF1654 domain-containing protein [Pseudomonas huanghezhanensis]|uniref:DUF1654 domain-containing protein n=1 Tax=Pseudomonas huanghezhanensis TaxID=3002903 RepID=UPI002285ECCA|nr:DUF1654 domain-containing protein [Pseudomonas sp. BSw22131]